MDDPLDADALRRLVDGDLSLLPRLKATPPARLDAIAREASLTVTAASVIGVLEARRDDQVTADETWRWTKLLLHRMHPYPGPEGASTVLRDLMRSAAAAERMLNARFDLPFEPGRERAMAHALKALYDDQGSEHLRVSTVRAAELIAAIEAGDPPPWTRKVDGTTVLLEGATVTRASLDDGCLVLELEHRGEEWRIDGCHVEPAGLVIERLPGMSVSACRAADGAPLEIELANGETIRLLPDDDYEGWNLSGPVTIISLPGGALASWDDDPRDCFHLTEPE